MLQNMIIMCEPFIMSIAYIMYNVVSNYLPTVGSLHHVEP